MALRKLVILCCLVGLTAVMVTPAAAKRGGSEPQDNIEDVVAWISGRGATPKHIRAQMAGTQPSAKPLTTKQLEARAKKEALRLQQEQAQERIRQEKESAKAARRAEHERAEEEVRRLAAARRRRKMEVEALETARKAAVTPPEPFDHYTAALFWPGSVCRTTADCSNLGPQLTFAFTIHGLWPEGASGARGPTECSGPLRHSPLQEFYESAVVPLGDAAVSELLRGWPAYSVKGAADQLPRLWKDVYFWKHEWLSHGTCSGLEPGAYLGEISRIAGMIQGRDDDSGCLRVGPPGRISSVRCLPRLLGLRPGRGTTLTVQEIMDVTNAVPMCDRKGNVVQLYICVNKDLDNVCEYSPAVRAMHLSNGAHTDCLQEGLGYESPVTFLPYRPEEYDSDSDDESTSDGDSAEEETSVIDIDTDEDVYSDVNLSRRPRVVSRFAPLDRLRAAPGLGSPAGPAGPWVYNGRNGLSKFGEDGGENLRAEYEVQERAIARENEVIFAFNKMKSVFTPFWSLRNLEEYPWYTPDIAPDRKTDQGVEYDWGPLDTEWRNRGLPLVGRGDFEDLFDVELGYIDKVVRARSDDPDLEACGADGTGPVDPRYQILYAVYNIRHPDVLTALVEASRRCVHVVVLLDSARMRNASPPDLTRYEHLVQSGFIEIVVGRTIDGRDKDETSTVELLKRAKSHSALIHISTGKGIMHLKSRLFRWHDHHANRPSQALVTGSLNVDEIATLNAESLFELEAESPATLESRIIDKYRGKIMDLIAGRGTRNSWIYGSPINVLFTRPSEGPTMAAKIVELLERVEEGGVAILTVAELHEVGSKDGGLVLETLMRVKEEKGLVVVVMIDGKKPTLPEHEAMIEAGIHFYKCRNHRFLFNAMHHKTMLLGLQSMAVVTDTTNWTPSALGAPGRSVINEESMLFIESLLLDDNRTGIRVLSEDLGVLRWCTSQKDFAHTNRHNPDGFPLLFERLSSLPAWPSVSVHFSVRTRTVPGESVWLVGDDRKLGGWEPAAGLELSPTECHDSVCLWRSGAVAVPFGSRLLFKPVVASEGREVAWMPGDNQALVADPVCHPLCELTSPPSSEEIRSVQQSPYSGRDLTVTSTVEWAR